MTPKNNLDVVEKVFSQEGVLLIGAAKGNRFNVDYRNAA